MRAIVLGLREIVNAVERHSIRLLARCTFAHALWSVATRSGMSIRWNQSAASADCVVRSFSSLLRVLLAGSTAPRNVRKLTRALRRKSQDVFLERIIHAGKVVWEYLLCPVQVKRIGGSLMPKKMQSPTLGEQQSYKQHLSGWILRRSKSFTFWLSALVLKPV